MKEKRSFPWKRVLLALAVALATAQLFREYFWIAAMAALWLCITVTWALLDLGRTHRKASKEEQRREEQDQAAEARRLEAFRQARYAPEDLAALDAHIQAHLGTAVRREAGPDPSRLDLACVFLAPTECHPFWRAATVGLGAWADGWPRAELVLPLEADWDPEDVSPFRLLRDAARQLVVVQNWVGVGSACKGSLAFLNAGFAGALVFDGLDCLPDMPPASLPGVGPVEFYWLLPLKKPEWDYAGERGLAALERRIDGPATYLGREPWVDPRTWFEEDITPFVWSQDGELYCLGLNETLWFQRLFLLAGLQDFGSGMRQLAEIYLWERQRDDVPFVEFSCEPDVFFAVSRDEDILRRLALGLSDLIRYRPITALNMLRPER